MTPYSRFTKANYCKVKSMMESQSGRSVEMCQVGRKLGEIWGRMSQCEKDKYCR